MEAKIQGLSVLVIDKMPVFDGNSTINGGAFAVAGSPQHLVKIHFRKVKSAIVMRLKVDSTRLNN